MKKGIIDECIKEQEGESHWRVDMVLTLIIRRRDRDSRKYSETQNWNPRFLIND